MALYVIGDLHLGEQVEKPMDVFSDKWKNHKEKLISGFSKITEDDVTVLAGDTSWAMHMRDAVEDFKFIDALPGQKIILKGNHDYWWESATKIKNLFRANDITTIDVLHNNFHFHGDMAICGTRGWFLENRQVPKDDKVYNREVMRLEASLKAAKQAGFDKISVFLHYPPIYVDSECTEIRVLMEEYGVMSCSFGHLHGSGTAIAFTGRLNGIEYRLISADYIHFTPVLIY